VKINLIVLGLLFFSACNISKHIPPNDALYTGSSVKIKDKSDDKKVKNKLGEDLAKLIRPRPNTKFLGMHFKLGIYYFFGPSRNKGLLEVIRKLGEPPVLLSQFSLDNNVKVLRNYMENRGFFKAEVTGDTTVKNKKAHASFTVQAGTLYKINQIEFPHDSTELGLAIKKTESSTLIKKGDPFNLDLIKGERTRIDAVLKDEGYYYFSPEYLLINADTTIGGNMVNLYVTVKSSTPLSARKPYTINDVYVYSNYTLATAGKDTIKEHAIFYNGFFVIDKDKLFKPQLFALAMRFKPGDLYNRKDHNIALNRLINLGVYKFVKNRFEVANEIPLDKLNAFYYLTPLPKKTLRTELGGNSKSSNSIGTAVSLSWRNKNTFHGAELLAVTATAGTDIQYGGTKNGFNTYNLGGEISFIIPKFVTPFFRTNTSSAYVPKSYIRLGFDLLNRQKLYTLNSFRGDLGYTWKPLERTEHKLNPISINYVQPINITQLYKDSAAHDPTLLKATEKQFIIGSNYTYTHDDVIDNPRGEGYYIVGNADLSGNIAGLLTGANASSGKQKSIFGAPFSQYFKIEMDARKYLAVGLKSIWANRLDLGYGIPYGNSLEIPFIKQFFIGGNNSIRAFRSRALGPGTFRPANADSSNFYPDQSGDIKLEINTELRTKLGGIVEGAVFLDAGNIWLKNKNPLKPGAEFSKDFLNQLAVGTGLGLRFNLSILLLRFDVAIPLRKPWLPAGQRWVINQIDFGSSKWFKDDVIFNLAIGYPF